MEGHPPPVQDNTKLTNGSILRIDPFVHRSEKTWLEFFVREVEENCAVFKDFYDGDRIDIYHPNYVLRITRF